MELNKSLLDDVKKYVDYISDFGEGEICLSSGIQRKSEVVRNELNQDIEKEILGYSIRLFIDGKEGTFSLKKLNKNVLDKIIKITKSNSKKEYFNGLPENNITKPKKLSSSKLKKFTFDKINTIQEDILSEIGNEVNYNSKISYDENIVYFLNTNGVEFKEKDYSISGSFSSVYNDSGYSDYISTCKNIEYRDFKQKALNSKKLAIKFYEADKLKEKPKSVTLLPDCFSSMINYSYSSNLSAKNIEKNRSIYDNFKTKAIDNNISIIDDPFIFGSESSSNYDLEGVNCKKSKIVDQGNLVNPITDYNTALENDLDYFGNYFSGVSFRNVIFEHENMLKESEYEKGDLLIDNVIGAHTSNSSTTEFSVNVHSAFYFDGSDFIPVNNFMISGKMKDMLDKSCGVVRYKKPLKSLYINALKSNCNVTLN